MEGSQWILAAFLGLSLAAATGLNAFLPLLIVGLGARYGWGGVQLNEQLAWLSSDTSLIVLAVATAVELIGDKIPTVDHALDSMGTLVRPVAGILVAATAFQAADPTTAAIAGLILGGPTAASIHAAKAGTRVASTGTTLGCFNPVLSIFEDVVTVILVLTGIFFPIVAPILLLALVTFLYFTVKWVRGLKKKRQTAASG